MGKIRKKIVVVISFAAIASFILFFNACKKTDTGTHLLVSKGTSDVEKRFFSNHLPTDELVQQIFEKISHDNDNLHFAEKIVEKVGYPFWDKAIIQQATSLNKNNRNAT